MKKYNAVPSEVKKKIREEKKKEKSTGVAQLGTAVSLNAPSSVRLSHSDDRDGAVYLLTQR